jgi:hypothetical protein
MISEVFLKLFTHQIKVKPIFSTNNGGLGFLGIGCSQAYNLFRPYVYNIIIQIGLECNLLFFGLTIYIRDA